MMYFRMMSSPMPEDVRINVEETYREDFLYLAEKSAAPHQEDVFSILCSIFRVLHRTTLFSTPTIVKPSRLVKASPAPFTKSQPRTEVWSVVWLFGSMHLQSNFLGLRRNDCSGSVNAFLWTEEKEQEEKGGGEGRGGEGTAGWGKSHKDLKKKKKIQRHQTGIKVNIAQSYSRIPNDSEVKGTHWRTYYVISPWRHAGDDESCQKSEERCFFFLLPDTEKVIAQRKQGDASAHMSR